MKNPNDFRPDIIAIKDENDPRIRECPRCHNWFSLLGIKDEFGFRRDYDHIPVAKGLCTCWTDWTIPPNN